MSIPTTYWKKRKKWREDNVVGTETSAPTYQAKLAVQLAGNIAVCLGEPDGEDSAGRAKVKLMAPEKIVRHACDIAELMAKEFDRRGWFSDIPELADEPEEITDRPGHPT